MNIGIFDSGLGGLIITKSLIEQMPEYNFSYLGDTAHLPYGDKSSDAIYNFTRLGIDYLFNKKNCKLVIIACNTASIASLRKLQQEYLPTHFPDRKILGVIIPTIEYVIKKGHHRIGLIATVNTVNSNVYTQEIRKIEPSANIMSIATPLIVPLVENNGDKFAPTVIQEYIDNFKDYNPDCIILGCTHYPHYKNLIREITAKTFSKPVDIICQDEIIGQSLKSYLSTHPEIEQELSKESKYNFSTTDITDNYKLRANSIFDRSILIDKASI